MSRNTRVVLIFGGFVTAVAAAFYPIFFHPLMHIDEYKKEQAVNRADVIQENVQPVGLKVWSDPFARK
ncbi:small integral membrane protein 20 [Spea bombifrons]|uniref:small integral membrane protein 20 n=1 Tax=Spea bombifrons TaxID=233779 RepID=UPI00234AD9AF|nr:small integral membrane protein 20 [Spea bombifrons]